MGQRRGEMAECYYCENAEKLNSLMILIRTIGCADIYLFRDQTHKGKCIVVYNGGHKTEWYKISKEERHIFIDVVSITAEALADVFHPDKINYATYGDIVNHLHVHVVPKYKSGPDWGRPFCDQEEPERLSDKEYAARVKAIGARITEILSERNIEGME